MPVAAGGITTLPGTNGFRDFVSPLLALHEVYGKEYVMNLKVVRVDSFGREWLRPRQLEEKYGLGRVTIWRLLSEMRTRPKYRRSIIDLSTKLRIVRDKDFLEFLYSKNKFYLRK